MANKIVLKKSSTASKVPLATDLDVGEIAVNLADQKLYSKNAGGSVILVGSGLGGTTVGQNFFTLTNPSAITFPRMNADNTVSALDAATFRTAIGAGTSSTTGTVTSITAGTGLSGGTITTSGTIALANTAVTAGSYTNANITVDAQGRITSASNGSGGSGTVTSVSGTGTVSGITLSGTVTSSGSLTLGGSLSVSRSNLPSGSILQAVNVLKQDAWSTTSTSYINITGMSATITPTSSTSKILVMTSLNLAGTNGTYHCYVRLNRNGSNISSSNGTWNTFPCMLHKNINDNRDMDCAVMNFLDSPATTSAVTYQLQMAVQANTFYVNRGGNTEVWSPSGISTITLLEVSA